MGFIWYLRTFFINLHSNYKVMKRKNVVTVLAVIMTVALVACGGKKKSEDVIAKRVVQTVSTTPQRMQAYTDERDVEWIGKKYHIAIHRQAADSLPMVKDETGQKFVDNLITLAVSRQDGSVFYSRSFRKTDFLQYLDADYSKTGILEGFVFDKADGDWLVFAASVSHPQTDEYIPLVVKLSRMGQLTMERDTQMDTSSDMPQQDQSSEEI